MNCVPRKNDVTQSQSLQTPYIYFDLKTHYIFIYITILSPTHLSVFNLYHQPRELIVHTIDLTDYSTL